MSLDSGPDVVDNEFNIDNVNCPFGLEFGSLTSSDPKEIQHYLRISCTFSNIKMITFTFLRESEDADAYYTQLECNA